MNPPAETSMTPVVAMLCTRGMEEFLANALSGMLRAGVAPAQIIVACPVDAEEVVRRVVGGHSPDIPVLADALLPSTDDDQYAAFGSRKFSDISWAKIALIRRLIEQHEHLVYADLDIGWLRNPLPYLIQVTSQYPIAFQTEGQPVFPPVLCCGFMSVRRSERSIAFLDALLAQSGETGDGRRFDDQDACKLIIDRDPAWLKDIYLLPEALFVNGLGYRTMRHERTEFDGMEGELRPFLFHANWTIGRDNKQKLMAMAHCWPVDGAGEAEDGPLISHPLPHLRRARRRRGPCPAMDRPSAWNGSTSLSGDRRRASGGPDRRGQLAERAAPFRYADPGPACAPGHRALECGRRRGQGAMAAVRRGPRLARQRRAGGAGAVDRSQSRQARMQLPDQESGQLPHRAADEAVVRSDAPALGTADELAAAASHRLCATP
jgi:hypothetical protein